MATSARPEYYIYGGGRLYGRGFVLKTHADFDTMMLLTIPVEVWQNGRFLDYGGLILSHTDERVEINENYYLKALCEFKVR